MPASYEPVASVPLFSASNEEVYELEEVPESDTRVKPSRSQPRFMPQHVHRALNQYASGQYGDTDSDTDSSEGTSTEGFPKEKLRLERKNEGRTSFDDIESQPAWARSSLKTADRNALRGRLAVPTVVLLVIVVLAAFFAGSTRLQGSTNVYTGVKKTISLDDIMSGKFRAEQQSIDWLAEAGDGVYSYRTSDNSIKLQDLSHNSSRILVKGSEVLDPAAGIHLDYQTFSVSSDLRYILFGADRDQLWRHSSRSNFYIHDLVHSKTISLIEPTFPSLTAIARWAPAGHSIAFVKENDLYVTLSTNFSSPIRVTSDGNATIFNGIPDWVYEEEVFGSDSAIWWSPDGKKLVFLRFDESEVMVYSFPVYNPDLFAPGASAYPKSVDMRYPKPGTPNPKVRVFCFDLEIYEQAGLDTALYELSIAKPLDIHDRVVTEIAWVDDHDLIVKETNRAGGRERVSHFDFSKKTENGQAQTGIVVRDVDYEKLDGGWVETGQSIHGVRTLVSGEEVSKKRDKEDLPPGYLDVVPDKDGFLHIAFYSPPDSSEPVFLTSGDWEVDGGIKGVDTKRKLIYFTAANPSTERHLYSVPLPTNSELGSYKNGSKPPSHTILTDTSKPGFYEVSFSPQAGFYLLHQRSGLPWQEVFKVGDDSFDFALTNNAHLNATLADYKIPVTTFKTVKVNGVSVNVAETLPPNVDTSGRTQYPVLFRPYGGPSSQVVQNVHRVDYTHFLASSLGYIVVEVDGRGTGHKGRAFRSVIRKNLGEAEAADQVAVAEVYCQLKYVDEKRIGIQGWSYGGYLTAKVLETNATVFSAGVSVAPVTDWRYYDTIYTERYMGTLDENGAGYTKSAVVNMDGFKHADFLLLHGSGDDNVHFLNSAALLDRLTVAQVRRFRFRMFTDSAHSMGVRGAYTELHTLMTDFLVEKLGTGKRVEREEDKWRP